MKTTYADKRTVQPKRATAADIHISDYMREMIFCHGATVIETWFGQQTVTMLLRAKRGSKQFENGGEEYEYAECSSYDRINEDGTRPVTIGTLRRGRGLVAVKKLANSSHYDSEYAYSRIQNKYTERREKETTKN